MLISLLSGMASPQLLLLSHALLHVCLARLMDVPQLTCRTLAVLISRPQVRTKYVEEEE